MIPGGPFDVTTASVLATLALAAALTMARLIRGPTMVDRVVALDLISLLVVGAIVTCAIRYEASVLLRPAIALALLAFLGTVAFASYIQRRVTP